MSIRDYPLQRGGWEILRLTAIAEQNERNEVRLADGRCGFLPVEREKPLDPAREPLEALEETRRTRIIHDDSDKGRLELFWLCGILQRCI